jgi:hypothetical protein
MHRPDRLDLCPAVSIPDGGNRFVRKTVLTALLALCLAPAVSMAQVTVRIGPPPPVHEHYGPRPHRGWVWQPGYHAWDGNRYVWHGGAWAEPPHPGAVWVPHHWVHRHGGWVMVEGHWR